MKQVEMIDTRGISPGPNDRTTFNRAALADLAANIAEFGLIQPITIRRVDALDGFEIVAGERRYRACRDILGWLEIPAIVQDLTDKEASAVMLAENIARADLDPIDEANAYASRMKRFDLTPAEIADQAGVTSVRVLFRLKLLRLRGELQQLVRNGQIKVGYAQILADANLDTNRQMLAITKLRDNAHPTTGWFRRLVNELLEQQAQGSMFDLALLTVQEASQEAVEEALPPTPADTSPPAQGKTARQIIENQAKFWTQAAEDWEVLGKPFKRQECQAAAQALTMALALLPADRPARKRRGKDRQERNERQESMFTVEDLPLFSQTPIRQLVTAG